MRDKPVGRRLLNAVIVFGLLAGPMLVTETMATPAHAMYSDGGGNGGGRTGSTGTGGGRTGSTGTSGSSASSTGTGGGGTGGARCTVTTFRSDTGSTKSNPATYSAPTTSGSPVTTTSSTLLGDGQKQVETKVTQKTTEVATWTEQEIYNVTTIHANCKTTTTVAYGAPVTHTAIVAGPVDVLSDTTQIVSACPAGETWQNVPNINGGECLADAQQISNLPPQARTSNVTIISANAGVELQDSQADPYAKFVWVPQDVIAKGASAIDQYLTAYNINTSLIITTGGTGEVSAALNQAVANANPNSAVLQIGGSNGVVGYQMLATALNSYQQGGITALVQATPALMNQAGATSGTQNPWAGTGTAGVTSSGVVGVSLANTNLVVPPPTGTCVP